LKDLPKPTLAADPAPDPAPAVDLQPPRSIELAWRRAGRVDGRPTVCRRTTAGRPDSRGL